MVEEEELALAVQAFNGFPGTKFESMFLTFAVPNQGLGVDTLETVILEEIQKVKDGDITQEELDRARTNARASLVRSLDSNSGLAQSLASADAQKGDWRTVFTDLEALNEVTLEDLQRVAKKYMTKDNLTVGAIVTKDSEEVADAAQ
jgi:predicted Zn-dependent peptidase